MGSVLNVTQTIALTTMATAITIMGTIAYQKWKKRTKMPTEWQKVATVKKLYIYPLKSGHRLEVDTAECTVVGLRQTEQPEKSFQLRDRSLIVYGAKDHEFRTARTYPKMVLIDISVHDENHLAVDAPTMRTLYVKIPNKNENTVIAIKCWNNERIHAIDCGDEAATWLSRYIIERDSGLRLGYHDVSQRRNITKTHHKLLSFYKNLGSESTGLYSDLSSLLLIHQASIDDMNSKIGDATITSENFRPNIIIEGEDLEPYEEDNWDWIRIGDETVCRNVKECTRCILTTINPENGVRNPSREPLKTLETYRKSTGPESSPVMGLNLGVKKTGSISVGDSIYIERKE